MNLSELKEQLVDTIKGRWGEFQESSLYMQAKEKYDDLSPVLQKVVGIGSICLLILVVLLLPLSWMSSSSNYIETFEGKKSLIRSFLQLKRDLAQAPAVPSKIPTAQLKNQVNDALLGLGLTADQIKGVEEVTLAPEQGGQLIPPTVEQAGVQVTISKVNLEQFVDISFRLQKLNPGAKLMSLDMKANSDDVHYYDIIYQLIAFAPPHELTAAAETGSEKE